MIERIRSQASVIFDTDILVKVALARTPYPQCAYDHAVQTHRLVFSAESFDELKATLLSADFDQYLSVDEREKYLRHVKGNADLVVPTSKIAISPDPKDNKIIDVALAASARFLVSNDKIGILSLRDNPAMNGIRVMPLFEYLRMPGCMFFNVAQADPYSVLFREKKAPA